MGRKKIKNKKVRFSITMNSELSKIVKDLRPNMSKYLEWLVYRDLYNHNKLDDDFIL